MPAPTCRYRLIRDSFEPNAVTLMPDGTTRLTGPPDIFHIQRSVRLFGRHLWWTQGYPYYFNDHTDAYCVMQHLCSGDDFESLQRWHEENAH